MTNWGKPERAPVSGVIDCLQEITIKKRIPYTCFHSPYTVHVVHTNACNDPFHGEVNGLDYCLPIFGNV